MLGDAFGRGKGKAGRLGLHPVPIPHGLVTRLFVQFVNIVFGILFCRMTLRNRSVRYFDTIG